MNWRFFLLPTLVPVEAVAPFPVYNDKMKAANLNGISFSFQLEKGADITKQLNGHFKVEHNDCGAKKFCGETTDFKSIGKAPINIHTVLDPCKSHTGIKIKASKYELNGGGVFMWTKNWKAINCSKLSAETETEAEKGVETDREAETEADTEKERATNAYVETGTKEIVETNFFKENSFQNSFILSSSILVIIAIAVTASICIFCKKQNNEKKKRNEQITTDENPMYGTYADGPMYNIVTDENYYYCN